MTIIDVYRKFSIPKNLQEHMFRVGAVGGIICDHLKEAVVDKELVVKTLLLHDMGNILKFDLTKTDLLAKEDQAKIENLKVRQKLFKIKYGSDPDKATLSIIKEITTDSRIVELCRESHWELAHEFVNTTQWERIICCYADMRVGPLGIVSLDERFDDLEVRRPEEKTALKVLRQQGKSLEGQIQAEVTINLRDIGDEMVELIIQEIKTRREFSL